MKLSRKIALILFRYVVILGVYFLIKCCIFETFTVKRGIVVNVGYCKYTSGRRFSYTYYPIVAFNGPGEDKHYNVSKLSPFDEVGNRIYQAGNIYFTHPPPDWHINEPTSIGDSMYYYYVNGDIGNASVLSLYSYWITESAIYWMILIGIIWTVIIDMRRLGKERKADKLSI